MKKDVVIIGGGASGIFSALSISTDKSVCILDNVPLGKKLLVTGNGRANLTNKDLNIRFYNRDLSSFFDRFNTQDTITTFKDLGIMTYADQEGRIYPITNTASSVYEILNYKLESLDNVEYIRKIAKRVSVCEYGYKIELEDDVIECKACIVACGGNAKLQLPNKVRINEFTPALCSLQTTENNGLNGIRVNPAHVSLLVDNIMEYSEIGEILFKDNGISGIVIMNISNHLPSQFQNAKLSIDLLPNYPHNDLKSILKQIIQNNKHLLVSQFLNGLIHKALASKILSKAKVNFSDKASTLTTTKINQIVDIIKNYTLDITGRLNNNQIYMGGIPLEDLNENLEHKNYPNLYFVGEFTEVIGHCGGYNLQWAFTSGSIAGKAINNKKD